MPLTIAAMTEMEPSLRRLRRKSLGAGALLVALAILTWAAGWGRLQGWLVMGVGLLSFAFAALIPRLAPYTRNSNTDQTSDSPH